MLWVGGRTVHFTHTGHSPGNLKWVYIVSKCTGSLAYKQAKYLMIAWRIHHHTNWWTASTANRPELGDNYPRSWQNKSGWMVRRRRRRCQPANETLLGTMLYYYLHSGKYCTPTYQPLPPPPSIHQHTLPQVLNKALLFLYWALRKGKPWTNSLAFKIPTAGQRLAGWLEPLPKWDWIN